MRKNYTNLILGIAIFMVLLVVSSFIFFFKVIQNKNEHTSKVLITLEDKMVNKKNAETLIAKLNELEDLEKKINNYFVNPIEIDTFVGYLERFGVDNDLELVVKNVEVSINKEDTILVEVSMVGDFDKIMRVIYLIENSPYVIDLTQVFINKKIKITETGDQKIKKEITISAWQADLSFSVLSLPK